MIVINVNQFLILFIFYSDFRWRTKLIKRNIYFKMKNYFFYSDFFMKRIIGDFTLNWNICLKFMFLYHRNEIIKFKIYLDIQ